MYGATRDKIPFSYLTVSNFIVLFARILCNESLNSHKLYSTENISFMSSDVVKT
jgi:hypothetical protein